MTVSANVFFKGCKFSIGIRTIKPETRRCFLYFRNHATLPSTSQVLTPKVKQKEQFNVGTIGHIDHGKTTLTAAITKVLSEKGNAKFMKFEDIDKAKEEQQRGITINIAHISYATEKRHYSHTDCPGHKDFIKNMICGTSQMDAAILVVAATDGAMPQTREHVMLAKRVGVSDVVIYINKCDCVDQEVIDLVELEARDLLHEFGFQDSNVHVVHGSALHALSDENATLGRNSVIKLLDCLDALPSPQRDTEAPFQMPVQSSLSVTGRGTVVIGTVSRGVLKKGDQFEIVGFGKSSKFVASDLQVFNKAQPLVKAGDHCGVLCRGLKKQDVRRGHWLCQPGSIKMHNVVRAECYMLTKEEGGRDKPIRTGFYQTIRCTTWEQGARLVLPVEGDNASEMVMPGDHVTAYFVLSKQMPIEQGLSFTVSEGGKNTIMSGVVSSILPNVDLSSPEEISRVYFDDDVIKLRKAK